MKTIIIAIALFITLSSVSSAQTQPIPKSISDIENIKAVPTGYRVEITGVQLHFIKFHEYYSESYKEIYENGELVDIMYGDQIYVYKTYTYTAHPTYDSPSK